MNTYDDKEIKDVKWAKYKIVVPTEEDRQELMEAFEHFHYADVDSNFVPVNQLIHEYMTPERSGNPETKNNIIVDADRYQQITKEYKEEVPLEVTEFEKKYLQLYNDVATMLKNNFSKPIPMTPGELLREWDRIRNLK